MPDFNPNDYQPGFGGLIDSSGNVKNSADVISGTGANAKLKVDIGDVDVTLNASDISLGAVELKDGTTDTRATIGANGLNVEVKGNTSAAPFYVAIVGSIDGGTF